jgi:copper chaperone
VRNLLKTTALLGGVNMGEITLIVDDMVCRYCKDMISRLITSIKGVSRVSINISDRTVNISYDSRMTDAHVIHMTLLKAGYKIIMESGKIL